MDHGWLDDLIALAECETLTLAAERRNVTQPAFSRRIQQIEQWLGAAVLDRTRRPARVTPAILRKIEDMRALTQELRRVRRDVQDWESAPRRVTIAAQHSISVSVLPRFVARLQDKASDISIRLRSANRDECYSLLMTRQVAITIAYETLRLPLAPDESLVEKLALGHEQLLPVASPHHAMQLPRSTHSQNELRVIAYPQDVFFGAVLARELLPQLTSRYRLNVACETALVPAVLGLALEGVGIAWLPRSTCGAHLQSGALVDLTRELGAAPISVVAIRVMTPRTRDADVVWQQLDLFWANERQPSH